MNVGIWMDGNIDGCRNSWMRTFGRVDGWIWIFGWMDGCLFG